MTEEAPVEGQEVTSPEGQAQAPATKAWYEGAAPEVVGYIQNKGWQETPMKAIEAYQNLEKFHGVPAEQLLKLPKNFDEEGALDPIYDKLGRPSKPEEYEITLPDGVQKDEARIKGFQELAHKLGLNKKQAAALVDFDTKHIQSMVEDYNTSRTMQFEADMAGLKKEWGSGFSEREELAKRAVREFLPSNTDKQALLSKIEDAIGSANLYKLFANIGDKALREDAIPTGEGNRQFGYTKEQALADKKQLMDEISVDRKRQDDYNNMKGPDYEKMQRLLSIIAKN